MSGTLNRPWSEGGRPSCLPEELLQNAGRTPLEVFAPLSREKEIESIVTALPRTPEAR